jgi:predicted AlkP superfamily phosphohydrolase/phosphomutase
VLLLAGAACHQHPAHNAHLIVLGVDGMDPSFVERHWDALPNLRALRNRGHFARLGTTTPPQSPVAWSSFITGLEPAEHGIFDFVHRDPVTLAPYSSMTRTEEPRFVLPLGPWRIPLSKARIMSLRQGTPFWQMLAERGVPVTVVRMPTNYPPVEAGFALSGMGTPDLRGTQGTFTYFTDDLEELSRSVPGGSIISIHPEHGHAALRLEGPPDTVHANAPATYATLDVDIDPNQPVARLQSGRTLAIVKQGEWSDWLPVEFSLIPHAASVHGMFRVFAKELHPGFELYVSAIQADPLSPALPVSNPKNWSARITEATGRFFTLGIPEDTAALRQNVLTRAEFEQQLRLVLADEHKLLRYSLAHSPDGLLFFYISVIDQASHMLWGRYEDELLAVYRAVDEEIGEVVRAAPKAELMVMSDHGFAAFDRAVNLNGWLRNRGFLAMNGNARDWNETEAYALGLNGLYVNHKVVTGKRAEALIANLREQLLAWRDPENNHTIVASVAQVHPSPANRAIAPDLVVGYSPGYRASWQTGVGETGAEELEDNRDAWMGDHCIDPAYVPGVLFANFAVPDRALNIRDLPGIILQRFSE